MAKAIAIIIAFSIKVACVMGSFNAVPKQAHWICCLLKRDCTTPIIVAPKIIKVMTNTWNTPILIYQGGKDYRVPIEQGLQAFQAAQLRGIKSKLVYLPDENHWVLSAQNAMVWQAEFFKWLKETL